MTNRTQIYNNIDSEGIEVTIFSDMTGFAMYKGQDWIGLWFNKDHNGYITLTDYDGTSGYLPRNIGYILLNWGIGNLDQFTENPL